MAKGKNSASLTAAVSSELRSKFDLNKFKEKKDVVCEHKVQRTKVDSP